MTQGEARHEWKKKFSEASCFIHIPKSDFPSYYPILIGTWLNKTQTEAEKKPLKTRQLVVINDLTSFKMSHEIFTFSEKTVAMEPEKQPCLKDLWRLTGVWNDLSALFTVGCCTWALLSCQFSEKWVPDDLGDDFDDMYTVFSWCSTVAFTAAILTALDVIGTIEISEQDLDLEDSNAQVDSSLMCCVYLLLGGFYGIMSWTGLTFVHVDMLAYGGPRPVFTLRYMQWCFCVPLLMVVGGRQHAQTNVTELVNELTNNPRQLKVLMPSLLQRLTAAPAGLYTALMESPLLSTIRLTLIYIFGSFLAVRVTDPFARWLLICVSFSDYLIASLQEIVLVLMLAEESNGFWWCRFWWTFWKRNLCNMNDCRYYRLAVVFLLPSYHFPAKQSQFRMFFIKTQESKSTFARNLAAFQVLIYASHGSIYLLSSCNLISAPLEQVLYGLGDVGAKLIHSIVLSASRKLRDGFKDFLIFYP